MADIELDAQIKLKVTRQEARRATKEAAEEAGKQVAKKTEDGFAKGTEQAGTRMRSILNRFGQIINVRVPTGMQQTAGLPSAPTAAAGGAAGAGALSRFVAAVGKGGVVVAAAVGIVAGAAVALKALVTRLLAFGRSLANSSALVARSFTVLDTRMDLLRLKIGNRLAPQIDMLTNSVARLFEQVGPKLVPAFAALFASVSAVVDLVAAIAPGGRGRQGVAANVLALTPPGILVTLFQELTDAIKGNTEEQKKFDFKVPPGEAGRVPALFDLIIGGAPQRAPAAGGQPGLRRQPAAGQRLFGDPVEVAQNDVDRQLVQLRDRNKKQ